MGNTTAYGQFVVDFPAKKPPKQLQNRIVAIIGIGVIAPCALVSSTMRSRTAGRGAILTRIVKSSAVTNYGNTARQAGDQGAFSLLGVARALDTQMHIGAACQATTRTPFGAAINGNVVSVRTFSAGRYREVAGISTSNTTAGCPRLLFFEPYLINRRNFMSRNSNNIINELLVSATGFVIAHVERHSSCAEHNLARCAGVKAYVKPRQLRLWYLCAKELLRYTS